MIDEELRNSLNQAIDIFKKNQRHQNNQDSFCYFESLTRCKSGFNQLINPITNAGRIAILNGVLISENLQSQVKFPLKFFLSNKNILIDNFQLNKFQSKQFREDENIFENNNNHVIRFEYLDGGYAMVDDNPQQYQLILKQLLNKLPNNVSQDQMFYDKKIQVIQNDITSQFYLIEQSQQNTQDYFKMFDLFCEMFDLYDQNFENLKCLLISQKLQHSELINLDYIQQSQNKQIQIFFESFSNIFKQINRFYEKMNSQFTTIQSQEQQKIAIRYDQAQFELKEAQQNNDQDMIIIKEQEIQQIYQIIIALNIRSDDIENFRFEPQILAINKKIQAQLLSNLQALQKNERKDLFNKNIELIKCIYETAEKKKKQEDRAHKLKYWLELINTQNFQLEYKDKYFNQVQIGQTHVDAQQQIKDLCKINVNIDYINCFAKLFKAIIQKPLQDTLDQYEFYLEHLQ